MVSQVRDSEYCILGVFSHLREAQRLVEETCISVHGIPAIEVWEGERVLHDEVPETVVYTAYLHEDGEIKLYQHVQRTPAIRATVVVNHSSVRAVGTDRDEVLQKVAEATPGK
ncbi:hypothetical protein COCCU_14210 (plasmid) [Corynebacterium occultum]|uniref:Uncharacterized protein n=1 Tax=Corynebacterium occultum TaxID=2675219 RepID=A0A6B8VT15_9CORY|nr:hypothetical protein COCCU_14210 [Corynebacterium occultum]